MTIPNSISFDTINSQVADSETSPRESSCDKLSKYLFDSPRRNTSKMKKTKITNETHTRKSEKIRAFTEQSPLSLSKVKKNHLERSKSFHGHPFQENILYTPPRSEKKRFLISPIDQLPPCKDIFSEMIINKEWLGKLEKSVLHGTILMPYGFNVLQERWKKDIQTTIDQACREQFGYSGLSEQAFNNNRELKVQSIMRSAKLDKMVLEPFLDLLTKLSDRLDEIAKDLSESTDLLAFFRKFLRQSLMKIHTFSGFLVLLKGIAVHKELYRLVSHLFLIDKNRNVEIIVFLQSLRDDAEAMYESQLKEMKWYRAQAPSLTQKHLFHWSEDINAPASINKIVRAQIIRSITTNGQRVINLFINDVEAEQTLEGIIHQLNRAGIDIEATQETSKEHAQEFMHDKWIPADGVLRLLSMGCWFHADQLIRKWFGEIYEIPMHSICKKGITCHVEIRDPFIYYVRQIKTFSVYRRRIPDDPECFTVLEPEVGQITFQWHVQPGAGGKWEGTLSILSWKLNAESPIDLKWIFMKALTHYHS